MTWPSAMNTQRSATLRANASSCVTTTIVMPVVGEILHHLQHLVDQLRIERARRLVEEQDARIRRHRARDRDPLLLPAGELARVGLRLVGEADPVEQLQRARARARRAARRAP